MENIIWGLIFWKSAVVVDVTPGGGRLPLTTRADGTYPPRNPSNKKMKKTTRLPGMYRIQIFISTILAAVRNPRVCVCIHMHTQCTIVPGSPFVTYILYCYVVILLLLLLSSFYYYYFFTFSSTFPLRLTPAPCFALTLIYYRFVVVRII